MNEEGVVVYPFKQSHEKYKNSKTLGFPCIKTKKLSKKVIVFDFDETLGSFSDLYYLWYSINKVEVDGTLAKEGNKDEDEVFTKVFNLYPEFLRYGILVILEFIYFKKIKGKCEKIFIYTNNQCNTKWVNQIVESISCKIPIIQKDVPLFDKIIHAFKIDNKIVEKERTTNRKTYNDFVKCTMLPKNTEICFIDDTYHVNMIHNKIYYIQPYVYCHNLTIDQILGRLFASGLVNVANHSKISNLFQDINPRNSQLLDCSVIVNNVQISHKLMFFIKEFLYNTNHPKTEKINKRIGKFTRKQTINRV